MSISNSSKKAIKIYPDCELDTAVRLVKKFEKDNVSGTVIYSFKGSDSYCVYETPTMIVVRKNYG